MRLRPPALPAVPGGVRPGRLAEAACGTRALQAACSGRSRPVRGGFGGGGDGSGRYSLEGERAEPPLPSAGRRAVRGFGFAFWAVLSRGVRRSSEWELSSLSDLDCLLSLSPRLVRWGTREELGRIRGRGLQPPCPRVGGLCFRESEELPLSGWESNSKGRPEKRPYPGGSFLSCRT